MIHKIDNKTTEGKKPIHVKPQFYSLCFYELKKIARRYGYNLVLNGSLNRDMDLIAIPWAKKIKPHEKMINAFVKYLGGELLKCGDENYTKLYHGRINYVINLNRNFNEEYIDLQYYLDISITPMNS